jgi:hypothetical protein
VTRSGFTTQKPFEKFGIGLKGGVLRLTEPRAGKMRRGGDGGEGTAQHCGKGRAQAGEMETKLSIRD